MSQDGLNPCDLCHEPTIRRTAKGIRKCDGCRLAARKKRGRKSDAERAALRVALPAYPETVRRRVEGIELELVRDVAALPVDLRTMYVRKIMLIAGDLLLREQGVLSPAGG